MKKCNHRGSDFRDLVWVDGLAGNMPCKYEDLSSDPHCPSKRQAHAYNPTSGIR